MAKIQTDLITNRKDRRFQMRLAAGFAALGILAASTGMVRADTKKLFDISNFSLEFRMIGVETSKNIDRLIAPIRDALDERKKPSRMRNGDLVAFIAPGIIKDNRVNVGGTELKELDYLLVLDGLETLNNYCFAIEVRTEPVRRLVGLISYDEQNLSIVYRCIHLLYIEVFDGVSSEYVASDASELSQVLIGER